MKKFKNRKSVLEQGGLMIEALAMLGLIAVVTPTMYKKSAERTMEVEDINTASAIRTYMNGIESLISANYTELMEKIPEPENDTPSIVPLDDNLKLTVGDDEVGARTELKKYLPYGYDAENNLYNYGQPRFAIARTGNNLSAFMVFPAKATGDDGIGQERTVRIASLIGSNGGYVSSSGAARGVGGTWTLSSNELSQIAGGEGASAPSEYSIVTSSIDVVNGSEGMGGDMTKYLQRTAENGETWRNTMRTDIYMGEIHNSGDDYDDKTTDGYFSIRNINQLIVGADGYIASKDTSNNQANDASDLGGLYKGAKAPTEGDGKDAFANFGLYIADNPTTGGSAHGVNAYIAGSLEAAERRLFTDKDELTYHGPKIQLGGIDQDETTGLATSFLIKGEVFKQTNGSTGETTNLGTLNLVKDRVIVSSDTDAEISVGNIDSADSGTQVLLMKNGDKSLDGNPGGDNQVDPISYDTQQPTPKFPVVVDSNMAVNGVLAAGQLDTQKIRAASLAVGSPNINDEKKWMNVDENGVRIHSRGDVDDVDDPETAGRFRASAEFSDQDIYMGVDQEPVFKDEHSAYVKLTQRENSKGVKIVAKGSADDEVKFLEEGLGYRSNGVTKFFIEDGPSSSDRFSGNDATDNTIDLSTGHIAVKMGNSQMAIGNPERKRKTSGDKDQYRILYQSGGHIDMIGTTLQVASEKVENNQLKHYPVFSVRGNDLNEGIDVPDYLVDSYISTNKQDQKEYIGGGKKDVGYRIAAHGNTVFTSTVGNTDGAESAVKYLAMGEDIHKEENWNKVEGPFDAAVNIVSGHNQTASDYNKRVIYIDLKAEHKTNYVTDSPDTASKHYYTMAVDDNRFVDEGSIYIRKGLIDIASVVPNGTGANPYVKRNADEAISTIRASRFVANNVDEDGYRVKYNNNITGSNPGYRGYNNSQATSGKYDTYMVNPAYTSVMKDIKLTSRFGARLSDILPNFITKRIYVSTNSYGEDAASPAVVDELVGTQGGNSPSSEGTSPYASPYLGSIPAPQCPPGYARAITVAPISFEMGTTGNLRKVGRKVGGTTFTSLDVSQEGMLGLTFDASDANNPKYKSLYAEGNNADTRTGDMFLENQPAYGRIRDLRKGEDKNGDFVPAQLHTSSGSLTKKGGSWDITPSDTGAGMFYNGTSAPNESLGDNENRVYLKGGLAYKATVNGVSVNGSEDGSIVPSAAMLDERSFADLRDKRLHIDHFGYGKADSPEEPDFDRETINNDPSLALNARVIATKYNEQGQLVDNLEVKKEDDNRDEGAYFLVTGDKNQRPLSFQKSTWLKTGFRELDTVGDGSGYKSGWSIMMGFIYPMDMYGPIVDALTGGAGLIEEDLDGDKNDDAYWNVFPVLTNTLSAYSTTYCFIDNLDSTLDGGSDYSKETNSFNSATQKAGNILYKLDDWNTSYSPTGDSLEVRQKYLNDPALKYDELW